MPSLKTIRRRIASVKNTQKITRAMKMVAAARLRRAQQRITELRPYAVKTAEVLASVASRLGSPQGASSQNTTAPLALPDGAPGNAQGSAQGGAYGGGVSAVEDDGAAHPLLTQRAVKRVTILTLSGDRGLAGGFNSSILRATERQLRDLEESGVEVSLAVIGRKGRDYFRRREYRIAHDYTGAYEGGAARAAEIARELMADFTSGETDQVLVIFNEFKSALTQKVVVHQVLPIKPEAPSKPSSTQTESGVGGMGDGTDYIYEPSRTQLLERLLPMHVEVTVFRAMLESVASFFGSQMTAMDSATKNAKKMIDSLTLVYNRARQAAITKELMEIIGGAEALKD